MLTKRLVDGNSAYHLIDILELKSAKSEEQRINELLDNIGEQDHTAEEVFNEPIADEPIADDESESKLYEDAFKDDGLGPDTGRAKGFINDDIMDFKLTPDETQRLTVAEKNEVYYLYKQSQRCRRTMLRCFGILSSGTHRDSIVIRRRIEFNDKKMRDAYRRFQDIKCGNCKTKTETSDIAQVINEASEVLVPAREQTRLSKSELIDGMCIAVQHAHSLNVLHRSISLDSFWVRGERVKLGKWGHSVLCPGNTSYKSPNKYDLVHVDKLDLPQSPEMTKMADSEYTQYGFEYDMWCLGMAIFELMYGTALHDEIDISDFTNEWLRDWIANHDTCGPVVDRAIYDIILKLLLTTDPHRRATSYAIKNMCDGPQTALYTEKSNTGRLNQALMENVYWEIHPLRTNVICYAEHDCGNKLSLGNGPIHSTCIDLRKPGKNTAKSRIMWRLMESVARSSVQQKIRQSRGAVVLMIFDILSQCVMNGDKPVTYPSWSPEKIYGTVLPLVRVLAEGLEELRF